MSSHLKQSKHKTNINNTPIVSHFATAGTHELWTLRTMYMLWARGLRILWALSMLDPAVFGWAVSVVVLVLLILVMTGWRYAGRLSRPSTVGVGGVGGFLGGLVGVPGPPVIMLYMASALPIAAIRANFLLYLLGIDVLMIAVFVVTDLLDPLAVTVGLICVPVYMCANVVGAWLFDPSAERLFRSLAYIVIALSAIVGLPVWS